MDNLKLFKTLNSIAKWSFLMLTIFLVVIYIPLLIDKILRPQFKSLSMNEFVVIGIALILMIGINLLWFGIFKTKSNKIK